MLNRASTHSNPFQAGGTLPEDLTSYIERAADRQLIYFIDQGSYAYFFAAPQSGKSSLMIHTRGVLQSWAEPVDVAYVDLSPHMAQWSGLQPTAPDALSRLFIQVTAANLGVEYRASGSSSGLEEFFRWCLERFPGKLILFIDEVNSLLGRPGAEALFTQIRSFYNLRAAANSVRERSAWGRLVFILAGFARAEELVRDPRLSPFNVSQEVRLEDLDLGETRALTANLGQGPWQLSPDLAEEVHQYTGGSVHLSQMLLAKVWRYADERNLELITRVHICDVAESIIKNAPLDRHFVSVHEAVTADPALEREARRLADSSRSTTDGALANRLRLTGITNAEGTAIRNEMYRRVFFSSSARLSVGRARVRNIAIAISTLTDSYQATIASAAMREAQNRGWNVLVFAGRTLDDPVFSRISQVNTTALIILGGAFHVEPTEMAKFCSRFASIPTLTVAMDIGHQHVASVLVNNRAGVREMMRHLVQEHGYKRIAFIRGPDKDYDARERYEGYVEALREHGLGFDHGLVVDGTFLPKSGHQAVSVLIDQRKVSFDAIFAANDAMAIGALDELNRRNLACPVVGFDDMEDARAMSPALTTIEQPLAKIGQDSVALALDLVERSGDPPCIPLHPTTPRFRESCGCPMTTLKAHATAASRDHVGVLLRKLRLPEDPIAKLDTAFSEYLTRRRHDAVRAKEEFIVSVRRALGPVVAGWGVGRPLDESDMSDPFLLTSWHYVLSALDAPPQQQEDGLRRDVGELRELAWGEIIAAAQRVRIRQKAESRRIGQALGELSRSLFAARSTNDVLEAAHKNLQRQEEKRDVSLGASASQRGLGIKECSIVFYTTRDIPSDSGVCMLEFDEHGNVRRDVPVAVGELAPLLQHDKSRFARAVLPLRVEGSVELGYMVVALDAALDWAVYHQVAEDLSSALHAARIYSEHQRYALTLEGLPKLTRDLAVLGSRAGTLHEVLERCAGIARQALGADLVAIYEWQAPRSADSRGRFVVDQRGPPRDGKFLEPEFMTSQEYPLERVFEILHSGSGFYGSQRYAQEYLDGPRAIGRGDRKPFAIREQVKAMAAIVLEIGSQKLGVMFVNYRNEHEFGPLEEDVHRAYATAAAIAIRQKQILARTVSKTRDVLDKVLSPIAAKGRGLVAEFDDCNDTQSDTLKTFVTELGWLANAYCEKEATALTSGEIEDLVRGAKGSKPLSVNVNVDNVPRTAFAVPSHLADVFATLVRLAIEQSATTLTVNGTWAKTAVLIVTFEDNGRLHEDLEDMFELTERTPVPWKDGRTLWWCRLTLLSHGAWIDYSPGAGGNRFVLTLPGDRDVSCW